MNITSDLEQVLANLKKQKEEQLSILNTLKEMEKEQDELSDRLDYALRLISNKVSKKGDLK